MLITYLFALNMQKSVKNLCKFQNNHFKLKTELFTVSIHKGLNETEFHQRVWLCQGNFDLRQGKSGKCQGILFCPVCMNPELEKCVLKLDL